MSPLRDATNKRPRGLAAWSPHAKTQPWIDAVLAVLDAERADWPVGPRHIAYQLVGQTIDGLLVAKGTDAAAKKSWKRAENKVQDICNRGRRAGIIPWEAITDAGITEAHPGGFHGEPSFWRWVADEAEDYHRNLLEPQSIRIEVWAEAAGMVPRLANVAHNYGVPVFSGGGFDSLDGKRRAAQRVLDAIFEDQCPFVALHVGDLDQHGHWLFGAIAEDVQAIARDQAHRTNGDGRADCRLDRDLTIRRLAVTPEQVDNYDLAADPETGNMQAEAVPAGIMRTLLTDALDELVDLELLNETRAAGEAERAGILDRLERRA